MFYFSKWFNSLNAKVAIICSSFAIICSANQLTGFYMMTTLAFNELTHFRPMLHLCRNQVVGFYWQNVWKTLWKSDILSKDAGR